MVSHQRGLAQRLIRSGDTPVDRREVRYRANVSSKGKGGIGGDPATMLLARREAVCNRASSPAVYDTLPLAPAGLATYHAPSVGEFGASTSGPGNLISKWKSVSKGTRDSEDRRQ